MAHGPDWSDSDDSLFNDDGDYTNFKEKIKSYNSPYSNNPPELTEEQKRIQELNLFFSTVSSGNIEGVTEFLRNGCTVDVNIRDGWTAILLSASYGNPDLTKVLIEQGADINQSRDGVTVLMMACNCPDSTSSFEKSLAVIKLLVEKGAKVQAINRKRMDALMYAACIGKRPEPPKKTVPTSSNLPAVKYLAPRADKRGVDNQRWNALTWAVSNNQAEVVDYLLSEGFDIHLTDVRNNTPLDIAISNGFESIVNLFPRKQADLVNEIIQTSRLEFEDSFFGETGKKPRLFGELCDILLAVKCSHLIPTFLEKNVTLDQFLSMTNDDLKEVGVVLPYQRNRILMGLHRFHKQPYNPKSLHVCVKSDTYSNLDVATQIMAAIKQIVAMEASLRFVLQTLEGEELANEEKEMTIKSIQNIKSKILSSKMVVRKLGVKFKEWDKKVQPPDLITKNSIRSKFPWKKITFCLGIISLILACKLKE